MQKFLIFGAGLAIGFGIGGGFGQQLKHWLDVEMIGVNGWVKRSTGADEQGRYSIVTNVEGNRVFLKRMYQTGAESNDAAEVGCSGEGTITFERSGRTTAYADLPPASVGRTVIDEVCEP